ncbi:dual oxidase maturation factor 1-like isoform X2 [Anneissia japonica]|uniref:dual oxidase maturation factor 1-like isoform X2 n=1 Tax=Anneissia japonica TaxID=1529436 RepID=UPI0014256F61|nr:dual oxidase maturation factor 1-like isoform X2 [Anneissia japonica]
MSINYSFCEPDCPGYDDKVFGFNAFRDKPVSPNYPPHPTAVTYDVTLAGLIFAAVILFVSFLFIMPGIRGIHRLWAFIRVTVSLFIGLTILLCLYGVDWEHGEVYVEHLPYKAFTRHEINATVGLHIGLKEINITLTGDPIGQSLEVNQTENINYNEQYTFCCGQGRTGFGPFAGRINREFRAAQWRGTPLPILWVLEYFTLDGENIRWGRAYRLTGWYTNIMLWTAFPLWLLSNILMFMVIRYGAYLLSLTGGCMLTGNIIFATLRNTLGAEEDFHWIPLEIPLNDESKLVLKYGWCFWMNMSVGLICVVLAFVIYAMDALYPLGTASFFDVDPLQDFEEQYIPVDSVNEKRPVSFYAGKSDGSVPPSVDLGYDDQPLYENAGQEKLVFKTKRKTLFAKNRSRKGPLSRPRDSLEQQNTKSL